MSNKVILSTIPTIEFKVTFGVGESLKIKNIAQPDSGKWISLKTGRILTTQNQKDLCYIDSTDQNYPRVAGTKDQMKKFFKDNNIKRIEKFEVLSSHASSPASTSSKPKKRMTAHERLLVNIPEDNLERINEVDKMSSVTLGWKERFLMKHKKVQKFSDFIGLTRKSDRNGETTSKKLDQLNAKQISEIPFFNLFGYTGLFIIDRTIDGDTFDVTFDIFGDFMSHEHSIDFQSRGKTKTKSSRHALPTNKNPKNSMIIKWKCRLWAYDTAEHYTWEGLLCHLILIEKLRKLNGKLYGRVMKVDTDKYGRLLIELYTDKKMTSKLYEIFDVKDPRKDFEKLKKYIQSMRHEQKDDFLTELNKYLSSRRSSTDVLGDRPHQSLVLGAGYDGGTKELYDPKTEATKKGLKFQIPFWVDPIWKSLKAEVVRL